MSGKIHCKCMTQKGTQCTRNAIADTMYCKIHQNCTNPLVENIPQPRAQEKTKAQFYPIPAPISQPNQNIRNPEYWLGDKPIESYSLSTTYGDYKLPNNTQFPKWITDHFGRFTMTENVTHNCNQSNTISTELFLHQQFIGEYMSPDKPYRGLLLYHDLGSGKTRTAINVAEKYRKLGTKVLVILPAALKHTWFNELKTWGNEDVRRPKDYNKLLKSQREKIDTKIEVNIKNGYDFVSSNASNTHKQLRDAIGTGRLTHRLVIVDEVHNLISRIISPSFNKDTKGHIGLSIYDMLMNAVDCKFLFLSATPLLNTPYELGILFNILKGHMVDKDKKRLTLFPENRDDFDRTYIHMGSESKTIELKNPETFQRRILGMTSYYYGGEGNVFPEVISEDVYCAFYETQPKDAVQLINYNNARWIEEQRETPRHKKIMDISTIRRIEEGKIKHEDISSTFRILSRLASNFAFPREIQRPQVHVGQRDPINLNLDPDPGKWNITQINTIKQLVQNDEDQYKSLTQAYKNLPNEIARYNLLKSYNGDLNTIINDELAFALDNMEMPQSYEEAINMAIELLKVYKEDLKNNLDKYSAKMAAILRKIRDGPQGLCFIYSNFITMEGIGIFAEILKLNGYEPLPYNQITDDNISTFKQELNDDQPGRYVIYSGSINQDDRDRILKIYKHKSNRYGNICKLFMGTPAAAEGLSLKNVRQVHIMEPHWNNVRIQQVIGRAKRICSHADLEEHERNVHVYKYFMTFSKEPDKTKDDFTEKTTDEVISEIAYKKQQINDQFLSILKNSAVDCVLNSVHNSTTTHPITCFQFPEGETGVVFNLKTEEMRDVDFERTRKIIKVKFQPYPHPNGEKYVVKVNNNNPPGYLYDKVRVTDKDPEQYYTALVLYDRPTADISGTLIPKKAFVDIKNTGILGDFKRYDNSAHFEIIVI